MFTLPELGYDYDALNQYISKDIMMLHHDKHHQTYVDKLNAALEGHADLANKEVSQLLTDLSQLPAEIKGVVRNHGGGHYNHSLFWQWMSPNGGGQPTGALIDAIIQKYGSFQAFVDEFNTKALAVFGSGWVWLQPDLSIITSPNQDSPLIDGKPAPILGLDVWEHAYYLDYRNKRDDYVKAWWNVVNWDFVATRFNDK
ncbi:MAG: superoxide dismutase [Candidatus Microsaccharimonas sp.]